MTDNKLVRYTDDDPEIVGNPQTSSWGAELQKRFAARDAKVAARKKQQAATATTSGTNQPEITRADKVS